MPEIPLAIQLSIAGGVVALTMAAIAFLLGQVKDFIPLIRPVNNHKAPQPKDVLIEVTGLSKKVDQLCAWHEAGRSGIPKEVDVGKMQYQTGQIYDLLSQKDRDGVPLVYIRVSLYDAIERMAQVLERNTSILERLAAKLER